MARGKRASRGKSGASEVAPPTAAAPPTPPPSANPITASPISGTNLVIADIVLRAAGGMLRERMEQGLLAKGLNAARGQTPGGALGFATSAVLWGASRLARRSPLGLAVVAGGLAAKLVYDRGKQLEAKRAKRKASRQPTATAANPAADPEPES